MKYVIRSIILATLLVLASGTAASVQGGAPSGACPDDFHLHNVMDMDDHDGQPHRHVGNAADQNGDGLVCVKHLTGVHVHIDNTVRPY